MPALYEHIRDHYIRMGLSVKEAKKRAAMIWNATHKNDPNPWNREKKGKRR